MEAILDVLFYALVFVVAKTILDSEGGGGKRARNHA